MKITPTLLLATLLSLFTTVCHGQLDLFQGDLDGWQAKLTSETLVDFDSIGGGLLQGNEYDTLPGSPAFASIYAHNGSGPFVDSHANAESSPNVLRATNASNSNDGVVRVTFGQPVYAVGASFWDVEGDLVFTGFGLGPNTDQPDVFFTSGASSIYTFLGFTTDSPISTLDIYFAATPGNRRGIDGVFIDNLRFSTTPAVPEPVVLGDVNMDGVADFLDIAPFISVLAAGGFQAEADVDQNGEVNFLDIGPFIDILSIQ